MTVAAAYSKRKRTDTQVLHPEVAARLREWLATKEKMPPDAPLFPISDKVLERIDTLLGHPQFDPHGDPIPGAKGRYQPVDHRDLTRCTLHQPLRIARVLGQDTDFLQTLDRLGLVPGTAIVIESRDRLADSVTVKPAGKRAVTLGTAAASKIQVQPA